MASEEQEPDQEEAPLKEPTDKRPPRRPDGTQRQVGWYQGAPTGESGGSSTGWGSH